MMGNNKNDKNSSIFNHNNNILNNNKYHHHHRAQSVIERTHSTKNDNKNCMTNDRNDKYGH